MINKLTLLLRQLFFLLTLFLSTTLLSQTMITVTDCNLNVWEKQTRPGMTLEFSAAAPKPPLGNGSLRYHNPTGINIIRVRNLSYHNTLLSSLTELRYSTFIEQRENNTDNVFVVLQLDRTGDGIVDDHFVFEPRYQTGKWVEGIAPDQGATVLNTWQTWDLLKGIWWFGPSPSTNPSLGGRYISFPEYLKQNPGARIINDAPAGTLGGGIRLNVGAPLIPVPAFGPNFIGYSDAFTIGVNGNTIIYDFEASIANAGEDRTVLYGYGSNCTRLTATGDGGVAPHSYAWSGGGVTANSQSMQVCPTTTTTYTLTTTDAKGCTGTDQVTVFVNDVRCGSKGDKVMLCHKGEVICVSPNAVKAHLNHGDELGACTTALSITKATEHAGEVDVSHQLRLMNYPNPFTNKTTIRYELPFNGVVSVQVFDLAGKVVAMPVSGHKPAGLHTIDFNSKNVSKGTYYYKVTVTSGNKMFTKTNKMTVLQ
jgi:hypothetical protein